MKKLTAILLTLLLSAGLSHAQITEVGPLVGGNFASIKGETGELAGPNGSAETGNRFGGRIGGFLRFSVSESFTVRTELTYSQKGATTNITGSSRTQDGSLVELEFDSILRYGYLDIPVLAEYTFQTGSKFEPYLLAGPTIGFSVNSEAETEVTATAFDRFGNEQEVDPDFFDDGTRDVDIETTDLGAVIGGGVSYTLESGDSVFLSGDSVFLDIRYNPSFTTLNSDNDIDLENQAITVEVGYTFSLR